VWVEKLQVKKKEEEEEAEEEAEEEVDQVYCWTCPLTLGGEKNHCIEYALYYPCGGLE
jgi:hypothetical protein